MTDVLWRRKEVLVPKTLFGLMAGASKEEAEAAAIASGEYRVDRRYQVSLDGGATWVECPKDVALCPLVDVDDNVVDPNDPINRTGQPSEAARAKVEQALRDAPTQAQQIDYSVLAKQGPSATREHKPFVNPHTGQRGERHFGGTPPPVKK